MGSLQYTKKNILIVFIREKPEAIGPVLAAFLRSPPDQPRLKVHKIENFFGFDFEIGTISLLVMSKY